PGGQGDDGLAPRGREAEDPAAARAAALLLGLCRQDVDADDSDLLAGVQLLDRRLDLDLVGVAVDRERVLVAGLRVAVAERRDVDRLLADHGTDDDVGCGQCAHAYTSSIRARAGCSISTMSAFSRSTTFSESARMTSTVGRLRADSSSFSSRPGATTRTRPWASRETRAPARSRGLIASIANASMILIASSPSFAVSAPRRARRFILRGRRCS